MAEYCPTGIPGRGGSLDNRYRGHGPAGARVILDEVFLAGVASQGRWKASLTGLSVLWVGVRCDSPIAAAREIARGNRIIGMAPSQAELAHQGIAYDLEVGISHAEALECARVIAVHACRS